MSTHPKHRFFGLCLALVAIAGCASAPRGISHGKKGYSFGFFSLIGAAPTVTLARETGSLPGVAVYRASALEDKDRPAIKQLTCRQGSGLRIGVYSRNLGVEYATREWADTSGQSLAVNLPSNVVSGSKVIVMAWCTMGTVTAERVGERPFDMKELDIPNQQRGIKCSLGSYDPTPKEAADLDRLCKGGTLRTLAAK